MSEYKPTVWKTGDVITAEKLNNIEDGIANAPVPTGKKEITSTAEVDVTNYATAQVVDEDLVAGNIKKDVDILGVVGSYEPTSDFSTAEVVVTNSTLTDVNGSLPNCNDENNSHILNPLVILSSAETQTLTVPLYKGSTWAYFQSYPNATLTGNIVNDGDGYYIITGNGSITFDGEL